MQVKIGTDRWFKSSEHLTNYLGYILLSNSNSVLKHRDLGGESYWVGDNLEPDFLNISSFVLFNNSDISNFFNMRRNIFSSISAFDLSDFKKWRCVRIDLFPDFDDTIDVLKQDIFDFSNILSRFIKLFYSKDKNIKCVVASSHFSEFRYLLDNDVDFSNAKYFIPHFHVLYNTLNDTINEFSVLFNYFFNCELSGIN